jgi:hypothetical protein
MRMKVVDLVHTAVDVSRCGCEVNGRKWGGHSTGDGNENSRGMEQAVRGQNKGTTITIYPDRLTLRDTADRRKHSRLQQQIETVKLDVSVFFPSCFLLSGFASQG